MSTYQVKDLTASTATSLPRPKVRRGLLDSWRIFSLPLLAFLALPILALFFRITPAAVWENLQQEQVRQAIQLSLVTSLSTVALTLVFGTPVAYYLAHRHYRYFRIVDTLVDLPTVLPPAVAGVALLMAFGRRGLLGFWLNALGITLPFTQVAVILAQTFIAAPLYIKSAAVGFAAVDCELKKAAALDGASRTEMFRYILLPMSWVSILTGAVMTWARALGEFGATIIFAGNFPGRTQTMPLAIYIGFQIDMTQAITLAVILIIFSFLILMVLKGFLHRTLEIIPEDTYD